MKNQQWSSETKPNKTIQRDHSMGDLTSWTPPPQIWVFNTLQKSSRLGANLIWKGYAVPGGVLQEKCIKCYAKCYKNRINFRFGEKAVGQDQI